MFSQLQPNPVIRPLLLRLLLATTTCLIMTVSYYSYIVQKTGDEKIESIMNGSVGVISKYVNEAFTYSPETFIDISSNLIESNPLIADIVIIEVDRNLKSRFIQSNGSTKPISNSALMNYTKRSLVNEQSSGNRILSFDGPVFTYQVAIKINRDYLSNQAIYDGLLNIFFTIVAFTIFIFLVIPQTRKSALGLHTLSEGLNRAALKNEYTILTDFKKSVIINDIYQSYNAVMNTLTAMKSQIEDLEQALEEKSSQIDTMHSLYHSKGGVIKDAISTIRSSVELLGAEELMNSSVVSAIILSADEFQVSEDDLNSQYLNNLTVEQLPLSNINEIVSRCIQLNVAAGGFFNCNKDRIVVANIGLLGITFTRIGEIINESNFGGVRASLDIANESPQEVILNLQLRFAKPDYAKELKIALMERFDIMFDFGHYSFEIYKTLYNSTLHINFPLRYLLEDISIITTLNFRDFESEKNHHIAIKKHVKFNKNGNFEAGVNYDFNNILIDIDETEKTVIDKIVARFPNAVMYCASAKAAPDFKGFVFRQTFKKPVSCQHLIERINHHSIIQGDDSIIDISHLRG